MYVYEYRFLIPQDQFDFLMGIINNESSILIKESIINISSNMTELELSPLESEEIRDSLTELLAKNGFNEDYSLNANGVLIEKLIDTFYII